MPTLTTNPKARYFYQKLDTFEAGIQLKGWEVKSVRNRRVSLRDSYVKIIGQEAFLINAFIPPYQKSKQDLDPKRSRKLLLKKNTITYLAGKTQQKNLTIVPISLYTKRNLIKAKIALVKGKGKAAKRREEKKEDVQRRIEIDVKEALKEPWG